MNILFTRFPLESALGGAEIQTLSLMKGLLKKGHAVAFLGSCPTLLAECRKRNIPVAELDIGPPPVTKWGAVSFAWRQKRMKAQMTTAMSQFSGLDTVCMLSLTEKILMTEDLTKKGLNVLWIEHDRVGRWLTKNLWLAELKRAASHATTVCVSELSRKIYVDLGWPEEGTVAIANGIDLVRFHGEPKPTTANRQLPKFHIGCVARLSPEKGTDLLIQAISSSPEMRLTIVGDGKEKMSLHTLIDEMRRREHPTESRIHIVPSVPDLGDFYRSIDVLVLPSREHDPFGLVAAEAMSVGTPVIVTDACGIAGYLTHDKDALIVPAESADALREALSTMMEPSVRERLGSAGAETAHRAFGIHTMIDRYEKLISKSAAR
jgi:glycosyltransferase involved in cell wall biosynthesis